MEKLKIRVEGMVCEHCEKAVKEAVQKLPGVENVKASKRKKEVEAKFDPALTGAEPIVQAIKDAGYRVVE